VRKLEVPLIDERTDGMDDRTLTCRSFGHQWVREPAGRERLLVMLQQGYKEIVFRCANGCGQTIVTVYNRSSGDVVEHRRDYGDRSYLVPKGTGRMDRTEARKALWLREDRELYRAPRRRH